MSGDFLLGVIILVCVLLLITLFVVVAFRTINKLAVKGGRSSRAFRRGSHVN